MVVAYGHTVPCEVFEKRCGLAVDCGLETVSCRSDGVLTRGMPQAASTRPALLSPEFINSSFE